ncbi:MAG: tRNA (adenosine(37)-N6)-threonylcarbamoyltransferase complex ATPase subunit type 1 TsaE [Pedobacter sp.]|nr:MAG: tRNA (adenosine(37)-N6)-threonylcarbamoyltransferase complex ATPase subunit type 1 TsaE [Pedobacter sp.]
MTLEIQQPEDLKQAATALLAFAGSAKLFIFEGEMGAGKTTFIKQVCQALGVDDLVSSPTFSIVNEYLSPSGSVYHFDFYRIKNLQEAYDIGYEDYFYSGDICLIEWPEKVTELLPPSYVKVSINILGDTRRSITFTKI